MNTFEKHTQNYIKERSNPLRSELIEKKQDDINNNLSVAIAVVVMIAVCAGIYKVVSLMELMEQVNQPKPVQMEQVYQAIYDCQDSGGIASVFGDFDGNAFSNYKLECKKKVLER